MPEEEELIPISSFPDAESINAGDKVTGLQGDENKNFSFSGILAWLVTAITSIFVPVSRKVNNKPLSSDISLTASDVGAINTSEIGIINGVAGLDGSGKVPASQLPPIPDSADDISYDGSIPGILSTTVQGAIDEIDATVKGKQAEIMASGVLKGDGAGGVSAAVAGTDYGTYSKPSGGIPASDLATGVIPSVPSAYASNPAMDGTASPGSSGAWARGDHVHPSDTSRVPTSRTINGYDLSADRSLTAADVGAEPADSTILKNKAGNATSLSIMGGATPAAAGNMVAVGQDAWSGNSGDIAIGKSSRATGVTSMALGFQAVATGANAIQLGAGTNADANTLKVGWRTLGTNYELLDENGIIPPGRMPVDASPTSGSGNLVTSGGIYSYYNNPLNLYNQSTDVHAANTSITLSESMAGYSWLIVRGYAGGTAAQQRFTLTIPVLGLSETAWYPIATSAGAGGIRLSGSGTTLTFVGSTYTALTVYQVYGKR